MRYLKETLLKEEKIIFWTRPHWIIFSPGVLALVAALFIAHYGPQFLRSPIVIGNLKATQLLTLAATAVGLFWLLQAFIRFKTSEYGITNKRVLIKTGWIQRNSLEVFLDKIEAVRVDQSILGRILDYGTLSVIGTGGTRDPYTAVPNPLGFRQKVQQQLDYYEHGEPNKQI